MLPLRKSYATPPFAAITTGLADRDIARVLLVLQHDQNHTECLIASALRVVLKGCISVSVFVSGSVSDCRLSKELTQKHQF